MRTLGATLTAAKCVALLLLGQLACTTSALHSGIASYESGRYPEALSRLTQLEARFECLSAEHQARYYLYRGLSELAVGNACEAQHWLRQVKQLVLRRQRLLTLADRGRLNAAWRSLGMMPSQLE